MSAVNKFLESTPPGAQLAKDLLHNYGLGLLFAANIFGAGSVYILSNTGAQFGYSLLWVMPLSLVVGLVMHEMSARLAVADEPLMVYIRDVIGSTAAKPFAIGISFVMHFWSVANYALAGAAFSYLSPVGGVYAMTIVAAGLGIALVELRLYQRIEGAIAALVLAIFGSYVVIFAGLDMPLGAVATGFVPSVVPEVGYLTMVIALLGTTIYYPNFFIQTSMDHEKEWADLSRYRKDHTFGLAAVVLLSVAVIAVAASTLSSGELTVTAPGEPLDPLLGRYGMAMFLIAAGAASFTSATGTLFGAGFMVPQAFGRETEFGDVPFRYTVHALIALSVALAVPILAFTDFTPVRLALTMPAVNGVVGLPITALALYGAVNRYYDVSRAEKAAFIGAVVVMFALAVLTADSLATTIAGFL